METTAGSTPVSGTMKLSELIQKDLIAKFEFYRDNKLYYSIVKEQKKYRFPISIDDSGSGYFNPEMKTVQLMRWIRKAIENEDLYIEDVKFYPSENKPECLF